MARRKQIPEFGSVEEESDFWDEADLTDYIDPDEPPIEVEIGGRLANSISLRMDDGMLDALKKLAKKRSMGYQTLMRMWVAERLEKELAEEAARRDKRAS